MKVNRRKKPTQGVSRNRATQVMGKTGGQRPQRKSIMVDFVILIDATSSMQPFIDVIMAALMQILDILAEGDLDVAMGLVVFRDELIGEETACYEVGTNASTIKSILSSTRATGGGDEPESSLPAINHALGLKGYRQGAQKVFLHITDASAHDPEDGLTSRTVLAGLKDENVMFYACSPDIDPYVTFANFTQGTLFPIEVGLEKDSFRGILSSFADTTVKTVRMAEDEAARETLIEEMKKTRLM
jgi:hypothetical protein